MQHSQPVTFPENVLQNTPIAKLHNVQCIYIHGIAQYTHHTPIPEINVHPKNTSRKARVGLDYLLGF